MDATGHHRSIAGFAVSFLFLAFVIASFVAQDPQPSPTASPQVSPDPSPSASATPTLPPRLPTPTPYPGAQNAHQWGSVTVFNGLPSDSVRAISQTPDGVMWFGTDNGLARFDGRRIQKIAVGENGAETITSLETLPTGELLAGTRRGAWVQTRGRFELAGNTQGSSVSTILVGSETIIGTDSGDVFRLTRAANGDIFAAPLLAEPLRGNEGTPLPITSLAEVDGKILASTSGRGVFVIEGGAAREYRTVPRPVFVNSLASTAGQGLWMGTEAARGASGVFAASLSGRAEKIAAPTADVFALEVNDGGLWAGTERYGLFHFEEGKLKKSYTFANTSGGLRSDTVYALFTDREGVLWIGTNRGVSRFDRLGPMQQTVSDSANGNFIRSLHQAREDWILAGSNRGLFVFEGKEWKNVPGFEGRVIHAIAEHNNTALLVGTSGGLLDETGRLVAPGDFRGFAKFRSRTYAAVFGRGVVMILSGQRGFGLPDRPTVLPVIFADDQVTAIAGDAERLWIGTATRGLYSFNGEAVKLEASPELLKTGAIWKMYSAGTGELWIAGQHGVFSFRDGAAERVVAVEDVRDVWAGPDGNIWAATTTKGVIHARRDETLGWLSTSIGFEQGLPSEKAFAIVARGEGRFLFATNRGVVTYHSRSVPPKLIPVRVLSLRVHDLAETSSTIALEYPQNSILVEVAGQSSRTFPEEFQYAYVLTNSKGETIDTRLTNDQQYTPNGLSPGEYSLGVVAFDRDLNASEPLTIRFSVATAPFPWTATALGVLLAISLFGLAWAIIEHRRIRLRTNELTAARFDLANEAERERRRIARDLHDQTLADLRNLVIHSDKLAGNGSFRSEIEAVSTEIRRICEDLSPSVLENVGLVAALDFLLSRTVENGSFHADDSADESVTFPLNVQLQIFRIAQEVLTNISKHSDAARVEMSVTVNEPGRFVMTVRDDGKLFQPAASNGSGRGVANIRSRANLIGAKVKWKRDKEDRNVFTLSLAESQAST